MADVLSFNLTQAKLHQPRVFKRPDLSTKLKLLGVDVASFGDFFADRDGPSHLPVRAAKKGVQEQSLFKTVVNGLPPPPVKALTYKDPFQAVYKKYLFTTDGMGQAVDSPFPSVFSYNRWQHLYKLFICWLHLSGLYVFLFRHV